MTDYEAREIVAQLATAFITDDEAGFDAIEAAQLPAGALLAEAALLARDVARFVLSEQIGRPADDFDITAEWHEARKTITAEITGHHAVTGAEIAPALEWLDAELAGEGPAVPACPATRALGTALRMAEIMWRPKPASEWAAFIATRG